MTIELQPDCLWCREQMATAIVAGLSGDDHARFVGHIQTCERCAQEMPSLRNVSHDHVAACHRLDEPA